MSPLEEYLTVTLPVCKRTTEGYQLQPEQQQHTIAVGDTFVTYFGSLLTISSINEYAQVYYTSSRMTHKAHTFMAWNSGDFVNGLWLVLEQNTNDNH